MSMPTTMTTLDRVSVRLTMRDRDEHDELYEYDLIVPGWLVAPGLAITDYHGIARPWPGQYSLTHLASGLCIASICGQHVDRAVRAAIATGIDWTGDRDQVLARRGELPPPTGDTWTWCPGSRPGCRRRRWPTVRAAKGRFCALP